MKALKNKGRKKMKKRKDIRTWTGVLRILLWVIIEFNQGEELTNKLSINRFIHLEEVHLLGSKEVIDVNAFEETPIKAMISKERPVDNALGMDGACSWELEDCPLVLFPCLVHLLIVYIKAKLIKLSRWRQDFF
ncbi:hypothetical protein Tco_0865300 [Tanacetum coccineum]